MKPQELGQIGEYVAEIFLRQNGYITWRPVKFIRFLELAVAYEGIRGESCEKEPPEPLTLTVPTDVGYISLTYWRGRCLSIDGRRITQLEYSIYAPCVKKCIKKAMGPLLEVFRPIARELLSYRRVLKTFDLFAFKNGVIYAVEVKTNGGKISDIQREKVVVLKNIRHLLIHVYLQNPVVKLERL